MYESNKYISQSPVGNVKDKASNSKIANPTHRTTKAWNHFVDMVNGKGISPRVVHKGHMIGLDYYNATNIEVGLLDFVKDVNVMNDGVFNSVRPGKFERINVFGL